MLPHFYKDAFCLFVFFALVFLTISCAKSEGVKKEVEYTVCHLQELPDELNILIEERKEKPFQFTYENTAHLYLAVGYGRQKSEEYVAALREIYRDRDRVVVDTILVSVSKLGEKEAGEPEVCPYIVLKCEKTEDVVLFCSAME